MLKHFQQAARECQKSTFAFLHESLDNKRAKSKKVAKSRLLLDFLKRCNVWTTQKMDLLNKCWLVFYILNVASNTVKNHCSALSVQSLALLQRLSVNQMSLLPKKISHTSEDRVDFHHTIWTLFQHLFPRQNREIFCDWKNANENLSKALY